MEYKENKIKEKQPFSRKLSGSTMISSNNKSYRLQNEYNRNGDKI